MPGTGPGHDATDLLSTINRRLQPRLRSRHALFPYLDLICVLQRKPDVVEAFEQAHAVGGRHVEGEVGSPGSTDGLRFEIDRERRRAVHCHHARFKRLRVLRPQHHRQQSVLQTVLAINVGEAAGHDAADVVGQHPPHRRLPRGTGAEILAGHQDARVPELRLVEHEIRILAAVRPLPCAHEQELLVVGFEIAHRRHRRDLIGVDVVLQQRNGNAGVFDERLHHAFPASNCRTSVMRPAMAVAAAVAGLTRWVRTPAHWRFSKLRLVVETQRSPGSPRSPLPPAHIEQPDSPQKNPASRKTRSRPAASAARFTVEEPGTTMAMTPSATCRPRTTAAAACRSGRRALVQEPMKTRSTGKPASVEPGCKPMYFSALSTAGRRLCSAAAGSGTRPVMPSTWLGSVPHVICGSSVLQSRTNSLSNVAPSSLPSVRQCASARSHIAPCGAHGRPLIQAKVASSGATKPERPPISMLRLQSVMRCSIGIAVTASPAYSTTWPRAPDTPISAIMRKATSLAVTCGPSLPSRRMRMLFGRFIAIAWVARICASSVVP